MSKSAKTSHISFAKNGFTLAELIVVMVIISILSTISVISYEGYVSGSRDTTRLNNMSDIKANINLQKLKQGYTSYPNAYFYLTNSGAEQALQGRLDSKVSILGMPNIPKDPLIGSPYLYSITKDRKTYEIAMTLENSGKNIAYVDGTYKPISRNIFPSLIVAINGSGSIEVGSGSDGSRYFILDGGNINLPYDLASGNITSSGADLQTLLNNVGVQISNIGNFQSCNDIHDIGRYMGAGNYSLTMPYGTVISNYCYCDGGPIPGLCSLLDNNLIGYWNMQAVHSGSLLEDISGFESHGTPIGSFLIGMAGGKYGKSTDFQGSSYFDITPSEKLKDSTGSLTISTWIRGLSYPGTAPILSSKDTCPPFSLSVGPSGAIFSLSSALSCKDNLSTTGFSPSPGDWHNLIATYDSSIGKRRVYIDGKINAEDTFSGPMSIGSENKLIGGDGSSNFIGYIDEVRVLDRVMSEKEVSDYYDYYK